MNADKITIMLIMQSNIIQPKEPLSPFGRFLFSKKPIITTYPKIAKMTMPIIPRIPAKKFPFLDAASKFDG